MVAHSAREIKTVYISILTFSIICHIILVEFMDKACSIVEDDIEFALEVRKTWHTQGHRWTRSYFFTNEILKEYIPGFDLDGKDVLTPTASGDHALNIALENPNTITCFDINRLARYWAELKQASIMTLSFDEFYKFILDGIANNTSNPYDNSLSNTLFKDKAIYNTIKEGMSKDVATFWDAINENEITKYDLFQSIRLKNCDFNGYMNPGKYKQLQQTLPKLDIKHVHCDILNLKKKFGDKKFDNIFTSNIAMYAGKNYQYLVENDIPEILKPNGKVQVYYSYANAGDGKHYPTFKGYTGETRNFASGRGAIHVLERCT